MSVDSRPTPTTVPNPTNDSGYQSPGFLVDAPLAPQPRSSAQAGVSLALSVLTAVLLLLAAIVSGAILWVGLLSNLAGETKDSEFADALGTAFVIIGVTGVVALGLAIAGLVLAIQGLRTKQRKLAIASLIVLAVEFAGLIVLALALAQPLLF